MRRTESWRISFGGSERRRILLVALTISLGILVSSAVSAALADETNLGLYNTVRIAVRTTESFAGTYTFSAYNSSGSLVSYYQSRYPMASFELPSSTYLFVVSYFMQSPNRCYPYPAAGASTVAPAGAASGVPAKIPPCYTEPASYEYGYLVQKVSSSVQLTILTKPLSQISTSVVRVGASYVNGTAASGVSISASIVGGYYGFAGAQENLNMYRQTGVDGSAELTVPQVPVQIAAWTWIPINLPKNITTVKTHVAGEEVNVTVYWQPMYLGLSGSQLIVPPHTDATITLHVQQPSFWGVPYAFQGAGTAGGVVQGAPSTGVPQTQNPFDNPALIPPSTVPQSIPPVQISQNAASANPGQNLVSVQSLAVIAAAVAVGLASSSFILVVRSRKP